MWSLRTEKDNLVAKKAEEDWLVAKKKAEANRRAEAQEMNQEVGARIEDQDPVLMTDIQTESLIYKSMGIALVGENGGVMGARLGINKM